jgi:hypothetical protein
MEIQLCEHGCGQAATHQTKSSLKSGPFGGRPVWQCAKSHNSCPAVKQRKIDASVEKYGTAYPWQTKEVREKMEQTNLEKYGHTCSMCGDQTQAKRKETMIERYGVEHPALNEELRKKIVVGTTQSYINDPLLAAKQIAAKTVKYGVGWKASVAKGKATQIAKGRWVDPSQLTAWQAYKRSVRYYTKKSYQQHSQTINPDNLQTGACLYQVDHLYSIRHGFENKVDPQIVGHHANLRMMWHTDNKSKHIRSDITLDELLQIAATKDVEQ